jgi:hypothetical protein
MNDGGKTLRKVGFSSNFSSINPTWIAMDINICLIGFGPTTKDVNYYKAFRKLCEPSDVLYNSLVKMTSQILCSFSILVKHKTAKKERKCSLTNTSQTKHCRLVFYKETKIVQSIYKLQLDDR